MQSYPREMSAKAAHSLSPALGPHRATTCNFIPVLEGHRMCGIIMKQPESAPHQSSGYLLTTAHSIAFRYEVPRWSLVINEITERRILKKIV